MTATAGPVGRVATAATRPACDPRMLRTPPRKISLDSNSWLFRVSFMTAASPPAAPTASPAPPADATAPTRAGALLSVIRGLIAFGQQLLATLQTAPETSAAASILRRFRGYTLEQVIARITNGLRLAAGLEERVTRNSSRIGHPPRRAAALATPRDRAAPTTAAVPSSPLPSASDIAAQLRHRPIGAVLEDICLHLGITTDCGFWDALQEAMSRHGGDPARFYKRLIKTWFPTPTPAAHPAPLPGPAGRPFAPPPAAAATGPP
jgi:hypothetical protein